jgi:steroid 5-alpha reductase family enzyme
MIEFWISLFVLGFALASVIYWIALRLQLMALVDLIWTAGLGLAALSYLLVSGAETTRSYVVALLVVFWSFRLSAHLFTDRIVKREEDPRYAALAAFWGKDAKRNFYFLFLTQVAFIALFLWPVSLAMVGGADAWLWSDWLAVGIAVSAFFGEAIADRQLAAFRGNAANKGQVCQGGLWRYSRHPNYFFEWLHWWAYVAFAVSHPHGWLTLFGPVAMYLFLRYLTGIPHAERSSLKSRGDAYRRYQQTTSVFFPWIPHEPQS